MVAQAMLNGAVAERDTGEMVVEVRVGAAMDVE